MQQWREYSDKFLNITPREQYLILLTGLVAITFSLYSFVIDENLQAITKDEKQIKQLTSSNRSMATSIETYEQALAKDPNQPVNKKIAKYELKIEEIDQALLLLTSNLIDPIQMRHALIKLLKLQKGVSLASFQLTGAQKLGLNSKKNDDKDTGNVDEDSSDEVNSLNLYRHGVKLKLRGSYFQLRDYLIQLEALPWKFFWQGFDYNLQEYPISELDIEMYSLSTKQEFIGV